MWEQALLSAEGNNCVANRMEGKMVMDRVKMWRRADVWEGKRGNEIVFCGKLERDLSEGMSAYHWVQNCLCVGLLTRKRNSEIYEAYSKSKGRLLIFKYWRVKTKLYACSAIY